MATTVIFATLSIVLAMLHRRALTKYDREKVKASRYLGRIADYLNRLEVDVIIKPTSKGFMYMFTGSDNRSCAMSTINNYPTKEKLMRDFRGDYSGLIPRFWNYSPDGNHTRINS